MSAMLTDYNSCIKCHLFERHYNIDLQCTVKGEHCHTFIKQVYKVDTLQFQDKLLKDRGKIFNQLLDLQLH
jgi:hypothetical protein